MNLQALLTLLREELKVHEKMLLAKREEQKLIVSARPAALLKNTEHISGLAEQVRILEEKRVGLTETLALELGLTGRPATLKHLLDQLPPENRAELEKTGEGLKAAAREIQGINQSNSRLLRRTLETLNHEIAGLVKPEESGLYTSGGTKAHGPVPRAGLNLRA